MPRTTTVARVKCWPCASWGTCSGRCRAWRVAAGLGKKGVGAYLPCVCEFQNTICLLPDKSFAFSEDARCCCPEKGRDTERGRGRKKEEQDGLFGWFMRTALDSYTYTQFVVVNVDFVSSCVCGKTRLARSSFRRSPRKDRFAASGCKRFFPRLSIGLLGPSELCSILITRVIQYASCVDWCSPSTRTKNTMTGGWTVVWA